jgi:hypothetical protein
VRAARASADGEPAGDCASGEGASGAGDPAAAATEEAGDGAAESSGSGQADRGRRAGGDPAPRGRGRRAVEGPGPAGWPGQFAQVLAETLAGSRPPRQIVPWTTEHARTRIRRLGPQLAAGQRPRVRRVRTCQPAPDVVEMTVVVGFGTRVRALAVRLERSAPVAAAPGRAARAARWLCTEVEAA